MLVNLLIKQLTTTLTISIVKEYIDVRYMQSESKAEPNKERSKHLIKSSDSESEEDENEPLTATEYEEVNSLTSGHVDDSPMLGKSSNSSHQELPLSDRSRTENNPYVRSPKGKEPAKEEIQRDQIQDPIVPDKVSDKASVHIDDKPVFNPINKLKEFVFGNSAVKAKDPLIVKPSDIASSSNEPVLTAAETRRRSETLLQSVLTKEEKEEYKKRLGNTNNEHIESSNRGESILSPGFLLANNDSRVASIDAGMKIAVSNLDSLAQQVGLNIEKSDVLVDKWDKRLKSIETLLKSLEDINWKKALTYTTIAITIIGFVYQCGIAGKLPNFAANVFNMIPTPNFSNVPRPKVTDESTLELIGKIMEKPVTFSPLHTLTGMGLLFGVITLVKILHIVRKIGK